MSQYLYKASPTQDSQGRAIVRLTSRHPFVHISLLKNKESRRELHQMLAASVVVIEEKSTSQVECQVDVSSGCVKAECQVSSFKKGFKNGSTTFWTGNFRSKSVLMILQIKKAYF